MSGKKAAYTTIDEYIAWCPEEVQPLLRRFRETIRRAAPDAQEKISWDMPTFVQQGNVAHFAAHKKHIGLYPGPAAIQAFASRLEGYPSSKGAVQFPLDKPVPWDVIHDMVVFSVEENRQLAEEKARAKAGGKEKKLP